MINNDIRTGNNNQPLLPLLISPPINPLYEESHYIIPLS